jgi:hypothetical protein
MGLRREIMFRNIETPEHFLNYSPVLTNFSQTKNPRMRIFSFLLRGPDVRRGPEVMSLVSYCYSTPLFCQYINI